MGGRRTGYCRPVIVMVVGWGLLSQLELYLPLRLSLFANLFANLKSLVVSDPFSFSSHLSVCRYRAPLRHTHTHKKTKLH